MSALSIVKIQLEALKNNNSKNDGIKKAYYYASLENRKFTGPLRRFINMVKNEQYSNLLNSDSYSIKKIESSKNIEQFECNVIKNSLNNKYIFTMKRSKKAYDRYARKYLDSNDWRTESVIRLQVNEVKKSDKQKNVFNSELHECSSNPMTGFFRDSFCHTDENDYGTHTVCSKVDNRFLRFSKKMGNDLITPRNGFPGLKEGDRWCLCYKRWLEALREGKAPKVDLNATNIATLKGIDIKTLKKSSIN